MMNKNYLFIENARRRILVFENEGEWNIPCVDGNDETEVKCNLFKKYGISIKITENMANMDDFTVYRAILNDEVNEPLLKYEFYTKNKIKRVVKNFEALEIMEKYHKKRMIDLYTWCIENGRDDILDCWDYEENRKRGIDIHSELYASTTLANWFVIQNGKKLSWEKEIILYTSKNTKIIDPIYNKTFKGYNDLATTHPHMLRYWDYDKNEKRPDEVTFSSHHKNIWWFCGCGKRHSYTDMPNTKSLNLDACPYKDGKRVLYGYNDLKTQFPSIAKEWHPTLNGNLKPEMKTYGSSTKVWWRCQKYHHTYEMEINKRTGSEARGCPYCSGKRLLKGFNDALTKKPYLIDMWSSNNKKGPDEYLAESHSKVLIICPTCGDEFEKEIHQIKGMCYCEKCQKELKTSFREYCLYLYIKRYFPDAIHNEKLIAGSNYRYDIFIPSLKLIIEYDGQAWHTDLVNDLKRDQATLKNLGVDILRVREPLCPKYPKNDIINIIKTIEPTNSNKFFEDYIKKVFDFIIGKYNLKIEYKINMSKDKKQFLEIFNDKRKNM